MLQIGIDLIHSKRGLQFEIIPSGHMQRVKRTKITVKVQNKRDLECIKVSGG